MEGKLQYLALLYMKNIDTATCIPEHSYVSVTGILDLGRSNVLTSALIKAEFKTIIYSNL